MRTQDKKLEQKGALVHLEWWNYWAETHTCALFIEQWTILMESCMYPLLCCRIKLQYFFFFQIQFYSSLELMCIHVYIASISVFQIVHWDATIALILSVTHFVCLCSDICCVPRTLLAAGASTTYSKLVSLLTLQAFCIVRWVVRYKVLVSRHTSFSSA